MTVWHFDLDGMKSCDKVFAYIPIFYTYSYFRFCVKQRTYLVLQSNFFSCLNFGKTTKKLSENHRQDFYEINFGYLAITFPKVARNLKVSPYINNTYVILSYRLVKNYEKINYFWAKYWTNISRFLAFLFKKNFNPLCH